MSNTPLQTRRWTRIEYDRLIELGTIQEDERLELPAGQRILRDRQIPAHATGIGSGQEALLSTFTLGAHSRVLSPIALDDDPEPAPEAVASYGWAYRSMQTLRPDEYVTPLAAPSARILVADLLP